MLMHLVCTAPFKVRYGPWFVNLTSVEGTQTGLNNLMLEEGVEVEGGSGKN